MKRITTFATPLLALQVHVWRVLRVGCLEPVSKPRSHQFPPGVSRRWRDASTVMKLVLGSLIAGAGFNLTASAERPLINGRMPAGAIGKFRLAQRPELNGVMQPVLLRAPKGATVGVAEGAGFTSSGVGAALVSLQVGETYRIKVSGIPNNYGDVYPTVELIDRMHAPVGKETRYPIPIDFTEEELAMALRGKFVTRVIYVEDPRRALGVREVPDQQRYFEVMSHEDPFNVASRLGRPVAILRMGSLAPGANGPTTEFLFGSPPIQHHAIVPPPVPYVPAKLKPSEMPAAPVKREELPEAPPQPPVVEDQVNIPEDLPEKNDVQDEPADDTLFDEGNGDIFDEPAADEVAPAPAGDDLGDDVGDPFSDDPGGLGDGDDLGDELDEGDLFDDI